MIKVGYLVSYDFELLFNSLPTVYEESDRIYIAIDKSRKTWAGNKFLLPDTFYTQIEKLDTSSKITFFEDNFYVPNLSPMENEIRERNLLLKEMGKGWLIQLDTDEYAYNFKDLVNELNKRKYLIKFNKILPISLSGKQLILFKKNNNGFFYLDNKTTFSFITNYPKYTGARKNANMLNIQIGSLFLHQAYARNEEEIYQKINNWGHKNDFNTTDFFNFWKSINIDNYKSFSNFHPEKPELWSSLSFTKSNNIQDFINNYDGSYKLSFKNVRIHTILVKNFGIKYKQTKRALKKRLYNIYRIIKL